MKYNDIEMSRTMTEWQKMAVAFPPLQRHEEAILADRAARGDERAQMKLFKHNSARVLFFALANGRPETRKKSHKPHAPPWPTHDEAASWAAEGLLWAVKHFHRGRIPFTQWANLCMRTLCWRMKASQDRKEMKQLSLQREATHLAGIDDEFIPAPELDIDRLLQVIRELCGEELHQKVQSLLHGSSPIARGHDEFILDQVREILVMNIGERGLERLGSLLEK